MPSSCRLCHGPLITAVPPSSPLVAVSAERAGITPPEEVDCHSHCLAFACPGCVATNKPSFSILNLKNDIYDYHCDACMGVVPEIQVQQVKAKNQVKVTANTNTNTLAVPVTPARALAPIAEMSEGMVA